MSTKNMKPSLLTKVRSRMDSWVMIDNQAPFVKLPKETIILTSPPRTSLSITSPNQPAGKAFSINSSSGTAYLTNQRIVYIPSHPTPALQSFSTPILHLQDTLVSAPFFGPNVVAGALRPVPAGGLPNTSYPLRLSMSFNDGGAYDFHSRYVELKEQLTQQLELARESGQAGPRRPGELLVGDLEQLPAYESTGVAPASSLEQERRAGDGRTEGEVTTTAAVAVAVAADAVRPVQPEASDCQQPMPSEPPPGYDEAMQSAVVVALEERAQEE